MRILFPYMEIPLATALPKALCHTQNLDSFPKRQGGVRTVVACQSDPHIEDLPLLFLARL